MPQYNIIEAIERTAFLPPYFAVTQKAIQLLNHSDVEFRELARVIETDQALVSRLLGLVNSAAYGLPRQVTRIEDAITYLGMKETRAIIVAASVRETFTSGIDRSSWIHSLVTANLAEALTKHLRKGMDMNEAFTSGLLHDIGKSFYEKRFPSASSLIRFHVQGGMGRMDAEEHIFGYDHAAIGEIILKRWNVPDRVCEAVSHHHIPWECRNPMAAVIALANQMAHWPDTDFQVDEKLLEFSKLPMSTLQDLYISIQISITEFESKLANF